MSNNGSLPAETLALYEAALRAEVEARRKWWERQEAMDLKELRWEQERNDERTKATASD